MENGFKGCQPKKKSPNLPFLKKLNMACPNKDKKRTGLSEEFITVTPRRTHRWTELLPELLLEAKNQVDSKRENLG